MAFILYWLLACHMLGDYVLQNDYLAETKGENWWHMLAHCVCYTVPFAVVFGVDWRIACLLASHMLIDTAKTRWHKIDYVSDQLAHAVVICAMYWWEVVA